MLTPRAFPFEVNRAINFVLLSPVSLIFRFFMMISLTG
jgi:hypothetical protein